MTKITPAFVLQPDGERISAELQPLEADLSYDNGNDRLAMVHLESDVELALPAPVVFDLPDFGIDGDYIRMRAADDLAGCAAILSALEQLAGSSAETDFYAVFTRAEEGGLFGARLMAEAGHAA